MKPNECHVGAVVKFGNACYSVYAESHKADVVVKDKLYTVSAFERFGNNYLVRLFDFKDPKSLSVELTVDSKTGDLLVWFARVGDYARRSQAVPIHLMKNKQTIQTDDYHDPIKLVDC